jgi:hypothetical protein
LTVSIDCTVPNAGTIAGTFATFAGAAFTGTAGGDAAGGGRAEASSASFQHPRPAASMTARVRTTALPRRNASTPFDTRPLCANSAQGQKFGGATRASLSDLPD